MSQQNTRLPEEKRSKESDFDFYLKSGLPSTQVVSLLKAQNKDQKEIDAFMEKYENARRKLKKAISKFVEKIEQKYGHLDNPELIRKGMKFASKYNLTQAEREAFLKFVLKGSVDTPYDPFPEMNYSDMSKALGFASYTGQTLSIKPTDYAALNEIARLYELSKPVQVAIRNNQLMYRSCGPEALSGKFDKQHNNPNLFVHPLIVAMFLPKIEPLEKRMLLSNIGRYVIQRSQAYFQSSADKRGKLPNWSININDIIPGELEADLELAYDIAKDPNSMAYFSDESPVSNLLKRQNIQIELWKNVLSLRQGKFFSKSDSFTSDDNVVGLTNVLSSYDWAYFDSPELYQVQDEGSMLRKLLAVFSLRPTFIQTMSLAGHSGSGYSNLATVSRMSYLNTPVCNVRLPVPVTVDGPVPQVSIETSLSQHDWFIENKMLVPKQKQVFFTRDIIFFYVNRRYQSVNLANLASGLRYLQLPGTLSNLTQLNPTQLTFNEQLTVGNDAFKLRSVVVLNPLGEGRISGGCSALVVCDPADCGGALGTEKLYACYNPILINYLYDNGDGVYQEKLPIQFMQEYSSSDGQYVGFHDSASVHGTVFIYAKANM